MVLFLARGIFDRMIRCSVVEGLVSAFPRQETSLHNVRLHPGVQSGIGEPLEK